MNEVTERYRSFVQRHRDKLPSVRIIPIAKQNRYQYVGGQIDGKKLYAVVNSAEKMLVYDIEKNNLSYLGDFSKDDFKWTGGCIYKNVFYSFPRKENCLLAFDIKEGSFSEIMCPFSYSGEHHYGGVCTDSGIIYQPPRNTNSILRWDINQRACSEIIINNGTKCRYCASVIHPGGYIYFIPEADACVLKMDIKTEEIVPVGEPVQGFAFDLKVAADGNIYGFRSGTHTSGILKIDTKNDTVSVLHKDLNFNAYSTKLGINGKLYSLPGYTGDVWEFDPETQKVRVIYSMDSTQSIYYAGGAVDRNGDIYGLPVFSEDILVLSFNSDEEIPEDIYQHFFVDFY